MNTDDPGVSGIEIADEYKLAREVVGLSATQLKQIQLNGVEVAFAEDSVKNQLLKSLRWFYFFLLLKTYALTSTDIPEIFLTEILLCNLLFLCSSKK